MIKTVKRESCLAFAWSGAAIWSASSGCTGTKMHGAPYTARVPTPSSSWDTARIARSRRWSASTWPHARASSFTRARRIMSLFEETFSLLPLSHWLPRYQTGNRGRFVQVRTLINRLLGPGRYRFTGQMEDGEYVFQLGSTRVPFPALSDGYRAFLGWIGDLLFHVCETCPRGKRLDENQGIVMVDEVDLHLHPAWQAELLPRLAGALPRIQFIATSHSPLLVGSLAWENIVIARQRRNGTSYLARTRVDVSKMDADQILLTELFGLRTTRSAAQSDRIRQLLEQTRLGDVGAARELMAELSGVES